MKIIRDEDFGGIAMIPLLVDWGVTRCNQKGCKNKPNTIITGASEDVPVFGLCEEHYQQGNKPGGTKYDLEFGDIAKGE